MSGPQDIPDDAPVVQRTNIHVDEDRLTATGAAKPDETLSLQEETLRVFKRNVVAGTVRVSTRTETSDDVAEVTLDHDVVDVTRVAIGQAVDVAPSVRTEGDTTIVPVVEERFVVVKQLYLKEELRIRRRVEQDVTRIPVQLCRQTATVEHLDADGELIAGPSISSRS